MVRIVSSIFAVKNYFDESDGKFGVEHEDCLVVPRVFAVKVDAVQNVLDHGVGDDGQQHRVLESEDQLKSAGPMLTIFGKTMESLIATEFRCCQTLRDF
jgi:hypothetical protein